MTEFITSLLVVVKVTVLILGSIVALLAYRAYRRTQIDGLQHFAVGLSIITLGTFLVGFFHHVVGVPLIAGMLFESLIVCVGFVVIMFGLYGQ
jgi:hypothetical protein